MGGSTVAQFLWQSYAVGAKDAAIALVSPILSAIVPTIQLAVMIAIVEIGRKMAVGSADYDLVVARISRMAIVVALLTPANFNTYICEFFGTEVPNRITSAVSGQANLEGAQGYDALIDASASYAAQTRARATGLEHLPDRITINIVEGITYIFIICCFFIWALAHSTVYYMLPVGALVLPFYIFDATREFTMRWFGKLVSLFLVMALSIMLGAYVVKQSAVYMQEHARVLQARGPDEGFQVNAGTMAWTGFTEGSAVVGPVLGQYSTANMDAAISSLWKHALVFAFGFFLMAIMIGIAMFIGMSHGFSAAPAVGALSMAVGAAMSRWQRRSQRQGQRQRA